MKNGDLKLSIKKCFVRRKQRNIFHNFPLAGKTATHNDKDDDVSHMSRVEMF